MPSRARVAWVLVLALMAFPFGCAEDGGSTGGGAGGGTGGGSGHGAGGGTGVGGGTGGGMGDGDAGIGGGGGDVGAGGGGGGDTGAGGGGGSTGAGGGGGDPGPMPTLEVDFDGPSDDFTSFIRGGGSIDLGVADDGAEDGMVGVLTLPGNAGFGPSDHVGPAFASELESNDTFGYGTFKVRVEPARCDTSEDAVTGIFTYAYGGDVNENGLTDNREIDIEMLCGNPYIIWLSIWTDYEEGGQFVKTTRSVDLRTGEYQQTPDDGHSQYDLGGVLGVIEGAIHPEFPVEGAFYEMGFEWTAGRVRYFIVLDGEEVTLWDYDEAEYIPSAPASFMLNVWHPDTHWWTNDAADYPANDADVRVDWFRYYAQ